MAAKRRPDAMAKGIARRQNADRIAAPGKDGRDRIRHRARPGQALAANERGREFQMPGAAGDQCRAFQQGARRGTEARHAVFANS